jgi:ParB-like chromosome segregation protein Spo0J
MPIDKISEIKYLPTDDLIPYARNSRTHSPEQVAELAGAIREFGFTNPVLIDPQGGIIAGHGRVMAARKLGMEAVPCIELRGLSENQKKAYVIWDNKSSLKSEWNEDMLRVELASLQDDGFDLGLTGFDDDEVLVLMGEGEEEDPDVPPESSAKEIDPDDYSMGCTCPRCGFEFDNDK